SWPGRWRRWPAPGCGHCRPATTCQCSPCYWVYWSRRWRSGSRPSGRARNPSRRPSSRSAADQAPGAGGDTGLGREGWHAVDEYLADALRLLQRLLEGRLVDDGDRVEDHQVGKATGFEATAIGQPEDTG